MDQVPPFSKVIWVPKQFPSPLCTLNKRKSRKYRKGRGLPDAHLQPEPAQPAHSLTCSPVAVSASPWPLAPLPSAARHRGAEARRGDKLPLPVHSPWSPTLSPSPSLFPYLVLLPSIRSPSPELLLSPPPATTAATTAPIPLRCVPELHDRHHRRPRLRAGAGSLSTAGPASFFFLGSSPPRQQLRQPRVFLGPSQQRR
jgi:hypothetical protein